MFKSHDYLINAIAQFKSAVLDSMLFYQATSGGFSDTLKCNPRIEPCNSHSVMTSIWVSSLVEAAGISATLDGSRYDMATVSMACVVMELTKGLAETPEYIA